MELLTITLLIVYFVILYTEIQKLKKGLANEKTFKELKQKAFRDQITIKFLNDEVDEVRASSENLEAATKAHIGMYDKQCCDLKDTIKKHETKTIWVKLFGEYFHNNEKVEILWAGETDYKEEIILVQTELNPACEIGVDWSVKDSQVDIPMKHIVGIKKLPPIESNPGDVGIDNETVAASDTIKEPKKPQTETLIPDLNEGFSVKTPVTVSGEAISQTPIDENTDAAKNISVIDATDAENLPLGMAHTLDTARPFDPSKGEISPTQTP